MDRRLTAVAVRVRPAVADDVDFVVGLAGRFAETRPSWRGEAEVTEGTQRELRRAFAAPSPDSIVVIAEDATGARIGFAYGVVHEDFFTRERHGHVSEIAVTRDGSGAATPLLAALEDHFAALAIRFVTLHVNVDNTHARAIYERLGFSPQYTSMVRQLQKP